jgi:hypothetical protein|tara:strand:+ start:526 stop:798 length:273 start_codon:yes stop_codon:yes gene_type:complete
MIEALRGFYFFWTIKGIQLMNILSIKPHPELKYLVHSKAQFIVLDHVDYMNITYYNEKPRITFQFASELQLSTELTEDLADQLEKMGFDL